MKQLINFTKVIYIHLNLPLLVLVSLQPLFNSQCLFKVSPLLLRTVVKKAMLLHPAGIFSALSSSLVVSVNALHTEISH